MPDVAFYLAEFNCNLKLLPEKAVFIEETHTLLIADPHFGKASTFRKGGIPIPDTLLHNDLKRLSKLVERSSAQNLLVLGDFFHSELNSEWDVFLAWKSQYTELNLKVIPGNHDRAMLKLLKAENLLTDSVLHQGPLQLRHEPPSDLSVPSICGHIHPSLTLRGAARQKVKLSAFVLLKNTLILPAFGSFTGYFDMSKSSYRRAWVAQEQHIWELKT
ncbi:MAG: ligase-associated DNA damage response endonuclease PdeM [Bacteroidia bacterium]|jgi:DNA ligase-associated metallophosphoesterase